MLSSCAYFNTFYNAEKYFNEADRIRLEKSDKAVPLRAMDNYGKTIQKCKIVLSDFPDSKYSDDAKDKLVTLRNTLARHEFYVAIYYTDISSNIAALNRCKFIIENYPNSLSIPDALYLMAWNYDLIGADELATDTREILYSSYKNYLPNYSIN